MEPNDCMRDRLLASLPQPSNLEQYRREVASLVEKSRKALRRQSQITYAVWIFCVCCSTALLRIGWRHIDIPKGPFLACLACFVLLVGLAGLLKCFINHGLVELRMEVKQIQLQVLELHGLMRAGGPGETSGPPRQ